MIRRLLLIVLLMLFALGEIAPALLVSAAQAQEEKKPKKRKTLFDMIFGEEETKPEVPVVDEPVQKPKKAASLSPPKPEVEKNTGATRLAVFGDSLAVDLAKALDRFYAEDPNLVVINQGVGSSGFVRPDFFDWTRTAAEQVAANSFDIAVMIIGINDRQTLKLDGKSLKPLTAEWSAAYQARAQAFVDAIHGAGKPIIWVGLPPMSKKDYSTAMGQISAIQRLAAFSGGAEFLDIYDRFVDENGEYSRAGPDLNGNRVNMRKEDGIHFTAAGADKLAFYLTQSIKLFYRGGGSVGIEIADALAGTDAGLMVRPPYQGLGQIRLLEVAGAVIPLSSTPRRASDLVLAGATPVAMEAEDGFDLTLLVDAPVGRADDFGVGKLPEAAAPGDQAALQP
ncbi:MAG: SGNH family hydrolase [Devosia sp.]